MVLQSRVLKFGFSAPGVLGLAPSGVSEVSMLPRRRSKTESWHLVVNIERSPEPAEYKVYII